MFCARALTVAMAALAQTLPTNGTLPISLFWPIISRTNLSGTFRLLASSILSLISINSIGRFAMAASAVIIIIIIITIAIIAIIATIVIASESFGGVVLVSWPFGRSALFPARSLKSAKVVH